MKLIKITTIIIIYIISSSLSYNIKLLLKPIESNYNIINLKETKNDKFIKDLYLTDSIKTKINDICQKLNISYNDLIIVIYHESKFNPNAICKSTNAKGLIGFMPQTLKWLKISSLPLNIIDQLDIVYLYLNKYNIPNNIYSIWLSIFYPYAINQTNNNNYIFGEELNIKRANKIAKYNKGFDYNNDGFIQMNEFKLYVDNYIKSL